MRQMYRIMGIFLGFALGATVALASPPPVISVQPTNTTVLKRDTASFYVTATSGTMLSYQWFFGTNAIANATNSSVTVPNVTSNSAGQYYVAVQNAAGTVNSQKATLTVLYPPPIANNDAYVVTQNATLTLSSPGVLANDMDPDGDSLTAQLVSGASHGTLRLGTNGGLVYTPATGWTGTDSFIYQAMDSDGLVSSNATVTLNVLALPTVSGLLASSITLNSAVLNASVDAGAVPAACLFHYGLSTNYSAASALTSLPPSVSAVSAPIAGLIDGTVYHYCLVVSNAAGITVSQDATFTTSVGAPSGSTLSATRITPNAATLNASVTQQLLALSCYFQYGTTTNYGSVSATTLIPALGGLLGGGGLFGVSTGIGGLTPGQIYHYRLVLNGLLGGASYSPDASFITTTLPPVQLGGGVSSSGVGQAGKMQLALTSAPGTSFTVLSSSNMHTWTVVGTMTEVAPGQYQYTDPVPATNPACWYRIRSP